MKKNTVRVLFMILIMLAACPAMGGAGPSAPAGSEDGFWKGGVSNQTEAFIRVVDNRKEWEDLWQRAFDRAAPEIDFEKKVVACVFLGHSADWLYSISIGELIRRGNRWVVPYGLAEMVLELAGPFKARGQYAMKVLEKKSGEPMVLEEDRRSGRRK